MASKKKEKSAVKKFWTRFIQKFRLLLRKGKRFFSILALPLNVLKDKYRRWPRILQIGALYLLVVILSGAVYLWRSAQLRTINPYLEDKFNFKELEDDELPENEDETAEQEPPGEPESNEPEDEETPPAEETAKPPSTWPVESRELAFDYHEIREEEPYMDISSHHGFYYAIGIKALPGEKVHSISGGMVKKIMDLSTPYGKTIVIEHDDDLKAYYGALDQVYVKKGQEVACGDIIATVKQNPEGKVSYLYLKIYDIKKEVFLNPEDILPKH